MKRTVYDIAVLCGTRLESATVAVDEFELDVLKRVSLALGKVSTEEEPLLFMYRVHGSSSWKFHTDAPLLVDGFQGSAEQGEKSP